VKQKCVLGSHWGAVKFCRKYGPPQVEGCCKISPAVPFRVIFLRKRICFLRKTWGESTGFCILQHFFVFKGTGSSGYSGE